MYKVQQGIAWIIYEKKKKAWEDELAWKMTTNININIYNDRHASKHHKEVKKNYEETLKILALNLETWLQSTLYNQLF